MHRYLDGDPDAVAPPHYIISRVAEEFPCYTPFEAAEALENDRTGLILLILEARSYARAKARYDATRDSKDKPTGPDIDQVEAIDHELAREWIAARKRQEE